MNAIEKRARFEEWAKAKSLIRISHGIRGEFSHLELLFEAFLEGSAALTPPEGYVLVPVEPTDVMLDAVPSSAHPRLRDEIKRLALEEWRKMIAARPEVPNVND